MSIEIDHLPVSSLLTLHGERGVGRVAGYDFDAEENADHLTMDIVCEHIETKKVIRFSLPWSEVRRSQDQDLCAYLHRRIEARGGLFM